jgi:hypothetical protein
MTKREDLLDQNCFDFPGGGSLRVDPTDVRTDSEGLAGVDCDIIFSQWDVDPRIEASVTLDETKPHKDRVVSIILDGNCVRVVDGI